VFAPFLPRPAVFFPGVSSPLLAGEVVGPALLLGPQFRIVLGGMVLELDFVRADDLLAAVLALWLCRSD
jgi:hypothetical protein